MGKDKFNMKNLAEKLAEVAAKFNVINVEERPIALKEEVIQAITSAAKLGYFYLDWKFSDNKIIVNRALSLLEKEGFEIQQMPSDIYHIRWSKYH